MPKRIDPKVKEMVKLLLFQGLAATVVSKKTGVKLAAIRTWAKRDGWATLMRQAKTDLATPAKQCLAVEVAQDMAAESKDVRRKLASAVKKQAAAIDQEEVSGASQLGNTPFGQGLASVTKTVAETAAKVFGWKDDDSRPIVNVNILAQLDPDAMQPAAQGEKPIDV